MPESRLNDDEQGIVEDTRRTLTGYFGIDETTWQRMLQAGSPLHSERWIVGLVIALAVVIIRRRRTQHGRVEIADRQLAGMVGGALGIDRTKDGQTEQRYLTRVLQAALRSELLASVREGVHQAAISLRIKNPEAWRDVAAAAAGPIRRTIRRKKRA